MSKSRILKVANMSFNAVRENTILAKKSEFTVKKIKMVIFYVFRVPEVKETVSLEENIRLLTPLVQAHFLCNISSKEFWETLQDLRKLKPIPTLQ